MSAYSSAVLADSPRGYWRMDDSSGTTMADSSGNGHNGTYTNTPTLSQTGALVADTASKAVKFNGTNQYASAAIDLSGETRIAVEFWLNWAAFAADDKLAMEFGTPFYTSSGQNGFVVDPDNSGIDSTKFMFAIGGSGGAQWQGFPRPSGAAWHHIVLDMDRAGNRSFADAVVTSGSKTVTSATANFTSADIGRQIAGLQLTAGTTIASINSATSIQLSVNAAGSLNPASCFIGPWNMLAYVDSVAQTLTPLTQQGVIGTHFGNTTLYLMSRSGSSLFCPANSLIDEVAIFSGGLSQARVTAHYLAAATTAVSGSDSLTITDVSALRAAIVDSDNPTFGYGGGALLKEDGGYLLTEDGFKLLLDGVNDAKLNVAVAAAEPATLADLVSIATILNSSDSANVGDAGVLSFAGADAVVATDVGMLSANETATDVALVSESAAAGPAVTGADVGTVTESASVVATLVSVDAVAVVDAAMSSSAFADSDSVLCAEVVGVGATLAGVDGGMLSEAASVSQLTLVSGSDSATTTDAAAVAATITGTESATTTDVAAVVAAEGVADSGTIADISTVGAVAAGTDSAILVDGSVVALDKTGTDSATFADAGIVSAVATVDDWGYLGDGTGTLTDEHDEPITDEHGVPITFTTNDAAHIAATVATTDSQSAVDEGALAADERSADAVTVVDGSQLNTGQTDVSGTDSATVGETAGLVIAVVVADAGTTVDVAAVAVAVAGVEVSGVADAGMVAAFEVGSDQGQFADAVVQSVVVGAADAVTAQDVSGLLASVTDMQSAVGSDAAVDAVAVGDVDAGTVTDSGVRVQTNASDIEGSDSVALVEVAQVAVAVAGVEGVSGADVGLVGAAVGSSDVGVLSESSLIGLAGADAATAVDAAQVGAAVGSADAVAAVDVASSAVAVTVADASSAAESSSVLAGVSATDVGLLSDAASATEAETVTGSDTGTATDIAGVLAAAVTADVVAEVDAGLVAAVVGGVDGASGSDAAAAAASVVAADQVSLVEAAAVAVSTAAVAKSGSDSFSAVEAALIDLTGADAFVVAESGRVAVQAVGVEVFAIVDLAAVAVALAAADRLTVVEVLAGLAAGVAVTDSALLVEAVRALTVAVAAADPASLVELARIAVGWDLGDVFVEGELAVVETGAPTKYGRGRASDRLGLSVGVSEGAGSSVRVSDRPEWGGGAVWDQ